jgi:hypothetical protein
MASDAPVEWTNYVDSLFQVGKAIKDVLGLGHNGSIRYLLEKTLNYPSGETQQNYGHAHGELSEPDGSTIRRSIFTQSFDLGDVADNISFTVNTSWVELLNFRCWVGPFKRLACEIKYTTDSEAKLIKFRIESGAANDSAAATAATNGLQEQTGHTTTTAAWRTIDGQQGSGGPPLVYAGSDTKLLVIDGPTSIADYDEMCSWREFVIDCISDTASTTVEILSVHLFEVLTTDEDGTLLT